MASARKPIQRTQPEYPVFISQSFINDARVNDVCPWYLKLKYIDLLEQDNEDEKNVMFRGRYFEWHLLGATRDGQEPVFNKLATGRTAPGGGKDYRPIPQVELDALIERAKQICADIGLDVSAGEKQKLIISEDLKGSLDWRTMWKDQRVIIDVKYTETAYDDHWRGWANFEGKDDSRVQARHYTILDYLETGEWTPFYFLIFGKSGWVRIIKAELTREGLDEHELLIQNTRDKALEWQKENWPAKPEFNKCAGCGYYQICKFKAKIPEIETYQI